MCALCGSVQRLIVSTSNICDLYYLFLLFSCYYTWPCLSYFTGMSESVGSPLPMVTVARARVSSSCLHRRSQFPTWLRLRSNQTVMGGRRGNGWAQHFSLWYEAGFSSWPARSAAISCRSQPQSYRAAIKNTPRQHPAPSIFYLMDWPPRLSHVSHVIPEPEPELRYGHANYGPGRGLQRAGEIISAAWDHTDAVLSGII